MISRNIGSFPVQKLPMSKKTKDWKEACVDYIIGKSGFNSGGGRNGRRLTMIYTIVSIMRKIFCTLQILLNRKMDSLLQHRIIT